MSLKEELNESLKKRSKSSSPNLGVASRGRCGVALWLVEQEEEFIKEFKDILTSEEPTILLYRFLAEKFDDLPFRLTTFKTHRNHWCSCP